MSASKAKATGPHSPRPYLGSCNQERSLPIVMEQMWFKPYDGQGPSSVALPPSADARQARPDSSDASLDRDRDLLMQDRSANDGRVRAAAPRRVGRRIKRARPARKVDGGGGSGLELPVGSAAREAAAGRNALGREFNEAVENVPITQNLGDQPDGRGAKQRLEKRAARENRWHNGGSGRASSTRRRSDCRAHRCIPWAVARDAPTGRDPHRRRCRAAPFADAGQKLAQPPPRSQQLRRSSASSSDRRATAPMANRAGGTPKAAEAPIPKFCCFS